MNHAIQLMRTSGRKSSLLHHEKMLAFPNTHEEGLTGDIAGWIPSFEGMTHTMGCLSR